ncbi:MAG: hypothetical protein COV37_16435 [Bdellovibrio sp. CG11_big_fil_rev_8_21_14_0_20_39_38]|nr:MAG: hypothetical protein COV37_16435 [Bdellovibrio sp. CG11_big_fil_rev_8_21_14_0_20_39_38]
MLKVWMTCEEVAKYLGRTPNAIRIMVFRGFLLKRKWKGRLYFKKSEIDRLLDEGPNLGDYHGN